MPITNPPFGSVLLKRTAVPGSTAGPDYFRITVWAYDPATRTAQAYTPADSTDDSTFSLPLTDIVDRYCLEPGAAPYTERRYFHNGTGGVTPADVDGVTACQVVCTLDVTLSAGPLVDGRAELTAETTGAQGPVEFSLDGFATPGYAPRGNNGGQPGCVFPDNRPGIYTVTVRETRAGGCVKTATAAITAPYGTRFTHTYRDGDTLWEIQLKERQYADEAAALVGLPAPAVVDWPGSPTDHVFTGLLRGSECRLSFLQQTIDQLAPVFSGDERLYLVELRRNEALFWTGYLPPEQFDVAHRGPKSTFTLSATDGLGTLSTIPFRAVTGAALRGQWTVLQVLCFVLGKLDLGLNLNVLHTLYPAGATLAAGALEQTHCDVAGYADEDGTPWDCGQVLLALLTGFQARLYQQDGAWWWERLADLATGELTHLSYAPDGSRNLVTPTRPPLQSIGADGLRWVTGSQRRGLRPAVATVTVTADAGEEPANLLRFALPQNSDLPGVRPASWSGYSTTPGTPYSQLLFTGKKEAPRLRLVGTTDSGSFGGFAQPVDDTKRRAQPWVQTPATTPMPGDITFLVLRFKVKPYGVTPNDNDQYQSQLPVAIKYGNLWLGPGGLPEDTAPVFSWVYLPDDKEIEAAIGGWVLRTPANLRGPQPASVRFYTPVGGKTAATAEITDIRLESGDTISGASYIPATDTYTTNTGQWVTRVDEGLHLFHADTPNVRYPGTLLQPNGVPVQGWFEAATPGQIRELGDFVVRDRGRFQRFPAQSLAGPLRGPLTGPGALLTDPDEPHPAVYAQTSTSIDTAMGQWQVTAVQLLTLAVPTAEVPADAIYHENGDLLLAEDGSIMTYEHV